MDVRMSDVEHTRSTQFACAAVLTSLLLVTVFGRSALAGPVTPESWTQRALALQYELSSDVGYRNAPWVGTHNSFNSIAEMGLTLADQDSNQQIAIVDQLELGIRSIELDLHWIFRPDLGGYAVVVCHARPAAEGNAGCTIEKPLEQVLTPIIAWLREPAHRDQVINVHLQDELDSAAAHDAAAATLTEQLGDLLYEPRTAATGQCAPLPLGLSRNDVRASQAQVVLVSDCGSGSAWPGLVFDWESHKEGRPLDYREYPACDQDFPRSEYKRNLIRYFEDSTQLTGGASEVGAGERRDPITVETAARMARCGVDLIDLDQLVAGDPRLAALVWSWAPGQPARGKCVLQRVGTKQPFGRWYSKSCDARRKAACRRRGGAWLITKRRVPQRAAHRLCKNRGAVHAVPRSGFEAQRLRRRMEREHAHSVWLGYRSRHGTWTALDHR